MFLRELVVSIDHIKGAGPATIRTLAQTGISNVADLLCRYPRDWEDRSRNVPLKQFQIAPVCTVVQVLAHDWFGFGAMKTLKVYVEDESAQAVLLCFNRPFMEKQLIVGKYYRIWGNFHYKHGELQSSSFEIESCDSQAGSTPLEDVYPSLGKKTSTARKSKVRKFGHILPVYPLSGSLSQSMLRRLIQQALAQYAGPLEDEIPLSIRQRDGFLPKSQALRAIHFPESLEELENARQTLIYEELFYLELMVGRRAQERREEGKEAAKSRNVKSARWDVDLEVKDGAAASYNSPQSSPSAFSPLQTQLCDRLPFALTPGQTEVVTEINRDIDGHYPMARLLQGDVGCGKTLVSFLAALREIEKGGQAAIMAPTELLARQHAENAARLLEPLGMRPAFLTGNIKSVGRSQLLKNLAAGTIDIVVGTHALFSKDVQYKNLRLVVVDEQHRFGVVQRQAIMAKGDHPDLLMMSATPIPRTLALTVFGDMDVSVIKDLPPGRKPVKTHLARESNETKVYHFVRNELAAGRQAYFVYPLIEANESKGLKDAESMAERLAQQVFPEYPTALVHSKLEDEEKRKTMEDFRKGIIRVLVATSVVEVGVDVPNASCMIVEHAERFGLAALHQLRGRVGRGEAQSYCFLVYSDELTEEGKTRLKVMLENSDGFVIAEEDLKLRGPGQITGTEQSGYLTLGIADPVRDAAVLERARTDAFAVLELDPQMSLQEHRCIAEVLTRASPFGNVVL